MPLPADQQAVADELIALYREAQDSLQRQMAAVLFDPSRVSQVARLRALAAQVRELRIALEDGTRSWLERNLVELHGAGAFAAAETVGSAFAWTAPHVAAVQALASGVLDGVAANLRGMEASTVRELRGLARDAGREVLLEGRTAVSAGTDLASWMGQRGIFTVTYANGAEHLAADYAETVARSSTARAYNEGTFTQARADDMGWLQCFDGPDCGLTDHDDPEKADGNVYPIEVAEQYPEAHPNCARSWAPAVGVTNQEEADAAAEFTPEESDARASAERTRAGSATTTLSGHAPRSIRTAREPATMRVGRGG